MKKEGDYAELLLAGTDGDSSPRPLFSFPRYAFSYIGIHRAFAAGAIYEYHYRIYFMVLQADAVTDRSAMRSERHARFIKFQRRGTEKRLAMGFLAFLISPANFSRTPRHVFDLRPRTCPAVRTVRGQRVKLDCVVVGLGT